MTSSPPATRLHELVLVVIVLLVGIMAGAASFTHVHDWTIVNSPTGTSDWFGWANAVISELIPTASLIEIGRRRRAGTPVGYPMFLLVGAVGVSLTAQLAVAEPTVSGWIVSALPALAFFALSKLVFTTTRPTNPVPASTPASSPAPSSDTPRAEDRPAAVTTTRATVPAVAPEHPSAPDIREEDLTPAPAAPVPAPTGTVPDPVPVAPSAIPPRLLTNARTIAAAHRHQHGEAITPGQLAVRLKVPTATATDILTALHTTPVLNDRPHNGSTVGATA